MNQVHAYFEPLVKKRIRNDRIATLLLFVVAAIGAAWGLSDSSDRAMARMSALSLIALVVMPIVFALSFRPNRGLAALANPQRIVWFYGVNRSGQVHAVMIGTDDGKLSRLPLQLVSVKEGFSQEGIKLLQMAAPHAVHGYSEEARVAFARNPASLRKG